MKKRFTRQQIQAAIAIDLGLLLGKRPSIQGITIDEETSTELSHGSLSLLPGEAHPALELAIAPASHRIDQAAPIFVADRVLVFEGEVVGGGDGVGNGDHGAGLGGAAPSLARGGGDRPTSPAQSWVVTMNI